MQAPWTVTTEVVAANLLLNMTSIYYLALFIQNSTTLSYVMRVENDKYLTIHILRIGLGT